MCLIVLISIHPARFLKHERGWGGAGGAGGDGGRSREKRNRDSAHRRNPYILSHIFPIRQPFEKETNAQKPAVDGILRTCKG